VRYAAPAVLFVATLAAACAAPQPNAPASPQSSCAECRRLTAEYLDIHAQLKSQESEETQRRRQIREKYQACVEANEPGTASCKISRFGRQAGATVKETFGALGAAGLKDRLRELDRRLSAGCTGAYLQCSRNGPSGIVSKPEGEEARSNPLFESP